MNEESIFCYCTVKEIEIIDNIVRLMDTSNNIKIDFILVSFSKKDCLDFSLKYSFENEFFRISPSTALISNVLLLDYLRSDYQTLTKINSSALVEVGKSFSSNFVTKYPIILKDYKSSSVSSVRLKADQQNKQQPSDRVVGEKVSFNDVGFKFKIDTKFVDQQTVSIKLNQSHSFLQGFVNDVPVTDKRNFKSQFLLTDGQLVPLFNLSSLLNSKSNKETIPFLSYFLPGKVDDDNSSYQVFLRFRFEDVQNSQKNQTSIVKLEDAKQTIDANSELKDIKGITNTDIDILNKEDEKLANELLAN
ncbi:hypothetical protein R5P06_05290 [Candidatus Thioglobus autotrophicus]|uniref:hypothetical protein n=1 Tax=Candidatus Thioglobus autotrophicus TaxID=1705394 RepID=UPI00299D0966|nr:hypothetical protein [Candidatus Thioglobus autotrophicus]WPE15966.1 hypothetical protein R5P06_05290 [Candidatus Thioglobus autotrophicus]